MVIVEDKKKKTDSFYTPLDWSVIPLGDLVEKIGSGITPTGGEKVYKKEGRPFIRSQNVGWGKLLLDDVSFIDEQTHDTFSSTEIKLNDVFLNITGASIGRSAKANEKVVGGNVNQHVCIIRTFETLLSSTYLNYFLLSGFGQKQIDAFQSGGNRQGLNFGQIANIQIAFPSSLSEQTAIALALSDADALITSLEKLIAKKQNIKKGGMQELLTPKENWVVKQLGDFLEYEQPTKYLVADTEYNDNNNVPVLTAGKTFILGYTHEEFGIFKDVPVIIFDDFTTAIKYVPFPFKAKSSAMKILKKRTNDVDLRFIYEVMQRIDYPMGTGDHKRHWIADYQFIEIKVPPTIREQNSISEILRDMDEEIFALEKRLSKAKSLKQAMMQQLLTGKIRLI